MWIPLSTIGETMYRRVCPLYTFDNAKRVQVVGSAIPFDNGDFHFLITATHVCFERTSKLPIPLFTMGHEEPRFLSGARIAWDYKPGNAPDLDLTLIHLPSDEAADLQHRYQFTVPSTTSEPMPKTPGVHYIIAGYPATRNRFISPKFYPSARATHLITGDITTVQGLCLPDKFDLTHFAISLPYKTVPTLLGGQFHVPKVSGMSGGGIWRLEIDIARSLAETPLLVGIGIEHHKSKGVFIATRVQQAVPLALDLFSYVKTGGWPDLAGA